MEALEAQYDQLLAEFWRGFAHPIRIQVLRLLQERGPLTVGELVTAIGIGQGHLSNHLTCLKTCGFVQVTPRGRFSEYALADQRISAILAQGEDVLRDHLVGVASCALVREETAADADMTEEGVRL